MEQMEKIDRIVSPKQAAELLSLSRSTFYDLIKKDDTFPKSLNIGKGRKGYLMSELQSYICQLAEKRNT